MQKPKFIMGSIVVVVVAIAWYLFRPELIFVNKTVNEALPGNASIKGSLNGHARERNMFGVALPDE
jgi:hypothetical protein